ncbi:MAG: hypothetical protein MUF71_08990 [Candidatus Kapabacteria bacterium]|jgi:hypothetical protein|nr:hypothetical protein [Candidatus Kapabacteria bacterium]
MNNKRYLRIIHETDNATLQAAQNLAAMLAQEFPTVTIDAPLSAHPRGGFILLCAFADAEIEVIARFLSNHGWRICF